MTTIAQTDRLPLPWGDEAQAVAALRQRLAGQLDWSDVRQRCEPWVHGVRARPGPVWAMESLLAQYPLSSQEGLALMRLAEALLRVPDADTALALTADQLRHEGQPGWQAAQAPAAHDGAASGLWQALSHRVLEMAQHLLPPADHAPQGWIARLGSQAVVKATATAVGLLARQFVLGETLSDAMRAAQADREAGQRQGQRLCMSYDMLGEGARTWPDADRYLAAYQGALAQLATATQGVGTGPHDRDGLSIKLSALHPRFEPQHTQAVLDELVPRLVGLANQAAQAQVLLTMDAEESWRLELQLAVLDALLQATKSLAWDGLGLAVQAYQLRAPAVIDEVARLARQHGKRLTVRLVKGAYWDSEVKRAQELGLPGFAVYTHKAHTDLSYLAGAHQLLAQHDVIKAQFATHNAATVAAVQQLAHRLGVPSGRLEWQRLHGMGDATWREILADPLTAGEGMPVLRVYAPVGPHRDLLPYLVRRLLENGANASFVHQLVAPQVPLDELLASPLLLADASHAPMARDVLPPAQIHGPERAGAAGRDPAVAAHRLGLQQALAQLPSEHLKPPMQADEANEANEADCAATMQALSAGFEAWEAMPVAARCQPLEAAADKLEADLDSWAAHIVVEARKTWGDAIAEVRETIDYARYYAGQAREHAQPRRMTGPTGEHNEWRLRGRGVWVCISPWNFPLAIFGGQVMAALAMGNTVAAKPAEQTPTLAARLVTLLHECGVPSSALALVAGPGHSVGAALVSHPACAGVAFTGSNATASRIARLLIDRQVAATGRDCPIVPLIAETGGINALVADTTALPEQLLDSVVQSAFGSAGQRCSSLRLLCLHEQLAPAFEPLLHGALNCLVLGDPADWRSDLGPVIDQAAAQRLHAHEDDLRRQGARLINQARLPVASTDLEQQVIAPSAWQLERVGQLQAEHFGPILHVVHWGPGTAAPTLDALIDQINALGFGLTLGIHTRIDSRAQHIAQRARVGNVYVNRGMTGANVGSQPFGGQGLSGTGPKAGGPIYLLRFATEQVVSINTAAAGGNAALMSQAR
jgi:RHH-type transcriptional regulator, proline utilization regulon repressor / proline dehydrogenase / delta 1-pyrroline-5-carboxylate dehydrogenase